MGDNKDDPYNIPTWWGSRGQQRKERTGPGFDERGMGGKNWGGEKPVIESVEKKRVWGEAKTTYFVGRQGQAH